MIAFQGGGTYNLIPDGDKTHVISSNVYEYVRKYAEYKMVKHCEKCLQVHVHNHPSILPKPHNLCTHVLLSVSSK